MRNHRIFHEADAVLTKGEMLEIEKEVDAISSLIDRDQETEADIGRLEYLEVVLEASLRRHRRQRLRLVVSQE